MARRKIEGLARKTRIGDREGGKRPRRLECPLALLGQDKRRERERKNNGRMDGWSRLDIKRIGLWTNVGQDKGGKKRKQQD